MIRSLMEVKNIINGSILKKVSGGIKPFKGYVVDQSIYTNNERKKACENLRRMTNFFLDILLVRNFSKIDLIIYRAPFYNRISRKPVKWEFFCFAFDFVACYHSRNSHKKETIMENLKLDTLRQDIKKILEPYLLKLLDIHKDNIVSILLYGSATGKFYVPRRSDINLMVALSSLHFNELRSSLKLVNEGIRKKITAPLFLSLEHIETSKDVFPVEFMEIKENHILLYGKDLCKDMNIDLRHLRLFCEREIKGKLIRLREAYLEVGLKKKGIEALLKESMNSLLPTFRALIRLKGQMPGVDKFNVLNEVSEMYGVEEGLFAAILRDRLNDEKIAGQAVEAFFEKYLDEIKKLALKVDKL